MKTNSTAFFIPAKRAFKALSLALAPLLVLTSCFGAGNNPSGTPQSSDGTASGTAVPSPYVSVSDMFSKRDLDSSYSSAGAVKISFDGSLASFDSPAVQFAEGKLTISDEGVYMLSGTLENGMVIVDADDADKVQLVFDGLTVDAASSAAVYAKNADKVFITLADGTENLLTGCESYVQFDSNNIDAVVFSKCDLTFNGPGTLRIDAPVGHGAVTKDDLVIASGHYVVTAASHGFSGKDSIRIADGSLVIDSGKDGLHADNTDDASHGFIYISDGEFDITAEGDGLSSSGRTEIDGGSFVISAGGGCEAVSDSSCCGIKADCGVLIHGGTLSVDSCDDGIHTNAAFGIDGGELSIMTGDDAVHADGAITVSGGTTSIPRSHEGLEGHTIDISGGSVSITADDDGINAAGGTDSSGFGGHHGKDDRFSGANDAYIAVSGGTLIVDSAGDGIDSNGSIAISGGEVYISGSISGENSAMDYEISAVISGGTFIAAGASQMAMSFDSSSTQGSALLALDGSPESSTIVLSDSSGNTLVSWTSPKQFTAVLVSCPGLKVGSSYTLTVGSSKTDFTLDTIAYGSGGGRGGAAFPGAPGNRGDGRPDGGPSAHASDTPDGEPGVPPSGMSDGGPGAPTSDRPDGGPGVPPSGMPDGGPGDGSEPPERP